MNSINDRVIEYLLTPIAIRETTDKIFQRALAGKTHFNLHLDKLEACSDYVMDVIKNNYPTLDIPFHSRWGHFKVGKVDREKLLDELIVTQDPTEIARIKLDLVIISVLLDAGAGKDWQYQEENHSFNRSEGLAVASYHMFKNGMFSEDGKLMADAKGLQKFSIDKLTAGFQVSDTNPLVGADGRVELIQKLGKTIEANPEIFPGGRPGNIIDYLCENLGNNFEVQDILDAVLKGLGPIWPGRIMVNDINLGDVWHYKPLGHEVNAESVICFHKLSQWLTYSLVVPMIKAGFIIDGAEKLTGLAEYRNGGLFLDFGVISLRDDNNFQQAHKPGSELIIEWRALTVQLLDQVGKLIQDKLEKSPADFPLAKVLEGGTWWAGRKIALEKRDGTTPITLDSDGTVF
ncbi:MAG: URC4/urg3 family protein [Halobacteriovoraceae bacterium]|nr:URC4/urg3 family protein [Halobacteriovoraceae bacterium]